MVCCVRFSADGKYLATGCNRTAQIYDTKTGVKTWYVFLSFFSRLQLNHVLLLVFLQMIQLENPAICTSAVFASAPMAST